MNYLKEIFTVFFSSVMGASVSVIITILAGRRDIKPFYKLFYSARFLGWIFLESIAFLLFIFGILKD